MKLNTIRFPVAHLPAVQRVAAMALFGSMRAQHFSVWATSSPTNNSLLTIIAEMLFSANTERYSYTKILINSILPFREIFLLHFFSDLPIQVFLVHRTSATWTQSRSAAISHKGYRRREACCGFAWYGLTNSICYSSWREYFCSLVLGRAGGDRTRRMMSILFL